MTTRRTLHVSTRLAPLAVALVCGGCGAGQGPTGGPPPGSAPGASTVDVGSAATDASASSPGGSAKRAPRRLVPPGGVASLPRADWPCDIDETLADLGGRQTLQLVYGERTECLLPADLAAQGLVGCADEIIAYNLGDDSPRYRLRFKYDASGRLVSMQDNDGAPDTFEWGPSLVQKGGGIERVYAPIEGGFEVIEDGKQAVVARVDAGRVVELTLSFFPLDRTLAQTIEWKGGRVARIDSGGDVLVPSYDCGTSGRRSKSESP